MLDEDNTKKEKETIATFREKVVSKFPVFIFSCSDISDSPRCEICEFYRQYKTMSDEIVSVCQETEFSGTAIFDCYYGMEGCEFKRKEK